MLVQERKKKIRAYVHLKDGKTFWNLLDAHKVQFFCFDKMDKCVLL
jgi:hypothetical protein